MEQLVNYDIYKDINKRTNGDIYLGVVGPVRTGKSTFIKRFMNLMVLPSMDNENEKRRAQDELPQSSAGKTIMTTEPKFIPKEAAHIHIVNENEEETKLKVRLIDCVGFMVEGANGHMENDKERMVKTPWFDYEIPFSKAAKIGTEKVIKDHSTVGIIVTTDGSIGDLPRQAYVPAEEQTIAELKSLHKPFIILVNSNKPYSEETINLAKSLQETYGVSTLPINCEQLKITDVYKILRLLLNEFPVCEISFHLPKWVELLPHTHPIKQDLIQNTKEILNRLTYMRDLTNKNLSYNSENIEELRIANKNLATGSISLQLEFKQSLYYQILSEYTKMEITSESQLLKLICEFAKMKEEYEKVKQALESVKGTGYGIVVPQKDEIVLEEPTVVKHGGKYGVKIKAQANSIHMIRSMIETEIAPIVGSEQQANDLISYIHANAATSLNGMWETNIFGKSIEQIVEDGISAKVSQMTDDCQMKLQDALKKIINDSNGGMICIII
ncbi:Stage IV sporulation protein A [Lachnospiraceae bacterium TWA4]|nr:Stage IV sporulation protein A [Lachnospiraceae bacterium TWA4]